MKTKKTSRQTGVFCSIMFLGMVLLVGCHARREVTPPETFPVRGTVVTQDQTPKPLPAGYQVQFVSKTSETNASGPVKEDGSFSMTTRYMGVSCDGVAEGSYKVMLVPPLGLANQGVPPYTLPEPLDITGEVTDLKIVYPGR